MRISIMVTMVILVVLLSYASAGTQLGSIERPIMKVLSRESLSENGTVNLNAGVATEDVTKLANTSSIFRGTLVSINITGVNANDKWIDISNHGIVSGNLTRWNLRNQENVSYTFPVFVLDSGSKVRIHSGIGTSDNSNLYTNSTTPLVNATGDVITLLDDSGILVGKYDVNVSPPTNATSS
jgi:hypothetical protein